MTKHFNAYKNPIILLSCQTPNSVPIIKNNTTSYLNFLLNKNKENIYLEASNNNEEKIRPANIDIDKKDIRLADINKQKPTTPNLILQNKLLSELSLNFKEITFDESEFLAGIPVLDT